MKCDKCDHDMQIGDFPFCPHVKASTVVIGDECDILIHHGLCYADGTPRRFRSKEELRKVATKRGLVNHVEHVPDSRGSDKSRHTTRWI